MPTVTSTLLGSGIANLFMGDISPSLLTVGAETTVTPPLTAFPTEFTVGVDAIPGWEPVTVIEDQPDDVYFFNTEGATYEDYQFIGTNVIIAQPHITLRRCELIGGTLANYAGGTTIANDALVEDCTIRYVPAGESQIGPGPTAFSLIAGCTMLRCALIDVNEGIRAGGAAGGYLSLMDPDDPGGLEAWDDFITDCYVRIYGPPLPYDWHGDCWEPGDTGLPGGGIKTTIRNSVFWADNTGPSGASSAMTTGYGHMLPFDIDGLILSGGGYTYYHRSGGDFRNMYFNDGSWAFNAMITDDPDGWDRTTTWENVKVCTIGEDGQPDEITGTIPFGWESGPFDPP